MTTTPTFIGFPAGVKEGSFDQTFDMTQSSSFRAGFITANSTVSGAYNALTAALNDGKAYLNIHSQTFPGGEIRGFPTRSLFTFNRSEASTYADIISGPVALTQSGAGALTLTGNNTYTGLTTVSAGTLLYGAANVISTGAVTVSGTGILNLGASQSDIVGTVTLQGTGQINGTGSSELTSTGTFEMQSGSVSAILAGNAIPLNKTTAGTVTLTGTNTYTGATDVSGGALVVNGSLGNTALTVRTGAQLGGSGTIGSGGGTTVSIESGGSLSPGNSPGMLTINGSLILSEGSTFSYEMVGGGVLADSIDVNGALNLGNASLNLTNLGNYTVNQKFTMFAYETMVGSFAGLANNAVFSGAGGTWKINYNDTSGGVNAGAAGASYVTLTAVSSIPEPRSVLVGGLLLAGLFLRQRRTKGF
jgi:autotransporter-associated beta strand protein